MPLDLINSVRGTLYGTLWDVKLNCGKAALPQTFAFAGEADISCALGKPGSILGYGLGIEATARKCVCTRPSA